MLMMLMVIQMRRSFCDGSKVQNWLHLSSSLFVFIYLWAFHVALDSNFKGNGMFKTCVVLLVDG